MQRVPVLFSCVCWFVAACGAWPAAGAPLEDLGSPDYATRERATRALLTDETRSVEALCGLFARATTPEQRVRLIDVICHHVVRQLREEAFDDRGGPAIGVSHEVLPAALVPRPAQAAGIGGDREAQRAGETGGAVYVLATLPGFPGHAWFEPGDLIVAIDGRPLPADLTADGFQAILRQSHAGEMLGFTVVRNGERLHVRLELASAAALARMYGNNPLLKPPYLGAWLAVRDRLADLAPPTPVLSVADEPR